MGLFGVGMGACLLQFIKHETPTLQYKGHQYAHLIAIPFHLTFILNFIFQKT